MTDSIEQIATDRRSTSGTRWIALAPFILGLMIAIAGLEYVRTHVLFKLEEAALGTQTQMIYDGGPNGRTLCQDPRDEPLCHESYVKAGQPPAILWLGNSQLPAINRPQTGDANAPALLHSELAKRGSYLVSFAQPNANLAEHALVFASLMQRYKPKVLILPVFLDDIRERGIRPYIADFAANPDARSSIEASPAWPYLAPLLTGGGDFQQVEAHGGDTLQRRVEAYVNGKLSDWWPLWRQRAQIRGIALIASHTARNRMLGINAQTKRRVDQSLYNEKMGILRATLDLARKNGVRVLLYIPPYRTDVPGPYVEADYTRLKQDLAALAQEFGNTFANLEDVVPGPEWGMVVDGIFGFEDYDFMHFTGDGHKRLASRLAAELNGMGF